MADLGGAGELPMGERPAAAAAFPATLARNLNQWVSIDDGAVWQIWDACRRGSPDCTEEEVLWFCRCKESLICSGRIENPVGLLVRSVPQSFANGGVRRSRTIGGNKRANRNGNEGGSVASRRWSSTTPSRARANSRGPGNYWDWGREATDARIREPDFLRRCSFSASRDGRAQIVARRRPTAAWGRGMAELTGAGAGAGATSRTAFAAFTRPHPNRGSNPEFPTESALRLSTESTS